jgi:hypothetical protein
MCRLVCLSCHRVTDPMYFMKTNVGERRFTTSISPSTRAPLTEYSWPAKLWDGTRFTGPDETCSVKEELERMRCHLHDRSPEERKRTSRLSVPVFHKHYCVPKELLPHVKQTLVFRSNQHQGTTHRRTMEPFGARSSPK